MLARELPPLYNRAMRWALYPCLIASLALICSCGRKEEEPPFQVRLVRGITAEPVAGGDVGWWFADLDLITGEMNYGDEQHATSGPDGYGSFPAVNPDRLGSQEYVLLEVKAPGFAEAYHLDSLTFTEGNRPTLVIGLLPVWGEARVEGTVRKASTLEPLAGATVTVTARRREGSPAEASGDPRYEAEKTYEVSSGEDGGYAIPVDYYALDRVSYWLGAVAVHEGFAYARFDLGASREETASGATVDYAVVSCDFYLSDESRNVSITGEMRDADGAPLPHTEVTVAAVNYMDTSARGAIGGTPQAAVIRPLVTDEAGRFALEMGAPYFYGLRNGIRVGYKDEMLFWRTPLEVGKQEAENVLIFRDGTTAGLSVSLAPG